MRRTNPYAKAWEELSHDSQISTLCGVDLDNDEVPVVAITATPNPVVITTKRIVWCSNGLMRHVYFYDLACVEAPESFHKSKLDISAVLVTTRSGEQHYIKTKPGKTLFILWKLLFEAHNETSRVAAQLDIKSLPRNYSAPTNFPSGTTSTFFVSVYALSPG